MTITKLSARPRDCDATCNRNSRESIGDCAKWRGADTSVPTPPPSPLSIASERVEHLLCFFGPREIRLDGERALQCLLGFPAVAGLRVGEAEMVLIAGVLPDPSPLLRAARGPRASPDPSCSRPSQACRSLPARFGIRLLAFCASCNARSRLPPSSAYIHARLFDATPAVGILLDDFLVLAPRLALLALHLVDHADHRRRADCLGLLGDDVLELLPRLVEPLLSDVQAAEHRVGVVRSGSAE